MPLLPAVAGSIVLALAGWRLAVRESTWWHGLHRPSGTPGLNRLGAIWILVHGAFGLGVGLAGRERLLGILAVATAVSALLWVYVLFRRQSVRNGFFMATVAWVPSTLAALAALVRSPVAGAVAGIHTLLMTAAVVWAFVLWQINEPTQYRRT